MNSWPSSGRKAPPGRKLRRCRPLTFRREEGGILDEQTGGEWNVLGEVVGGELEGEKLEAVASIDHFWFPWAAFRPETRVHEP